MIISLLCLHKQKEGKITRIELTRSTQLSSIITHGCLTNRKCENPFDPKRDPRSSSGCSGFTADSMPAEWETEAPSRVKLTASLDFEYSFLFYDPLYFSISR